MTWWRQVTSHFLNQYKRRLGPYRWDFENSSMSFTALNGISPPWHDIQFRWTQHPQIKCLCLPAATTYLMWWSSVYVRTTRSCAGYCSACTTVCAAVSPAEPSIWVSYCCLPTTMYLYVRPEYVFLFCILTYPPCVMQLVHGGTFHRYGFVVEIFVIISSLVYMYSGLRLYGWGIQNVVINAHMAFKI